MTDQELHPYDRTISWAENWLEKGYINAWFKWVEWITLTSVLITVAMKAPNCFFTLLVSIPSIVSLLMVYFSGIVAASKLKELLNRKLEVNEKLGGFLSFTIGVVAPTIMLYIILLVIFTLTDAA